MKIKCLFKKTDQVITRCLWRTPDGQTLKMMKNKHYDGGRLQCLCNEVDICYPSLMFIMMLPSGLQTSVESHIEHTCGIIIDGLQQKDAGKWQCHLDFEDEDTGQTGNEVQEYTFKVAEKPGSEKLCGLKRKDINVDGGLKSLFCIKLRIGFLVRRVQKYQEGFACQTNI